MIDFKIGESVFDFKNFAKHHKRIPIMIKRTHEDGKVEDLVVDEQLRKDIEANPDKVFTVTAHVYSDDKLKPVKDQYVWLDNAEYIEECVDYYETRISNTRQTTHVRLKFQFENARAYLDYSFKTEGSFAMGFDSLCSHGFIADIINEAVEELDYPLYEIGFDRVAEEDEYQVMVVGSDGHVIDITVPMYEIEGAFIGIEVYKFEQEIVTDEKELEEMR